MDEIDGIREGMVEENGIISFAFGKQRVVHLDIETKMTALSSPIHIKKGHLIEARGQNTGLRAVGMVKRSQHRK